MRAAVCLAQVGVDSSLGLSTLPRNFTVGNPDTIGVLSLPTCNTALTDCPKQYERPDTNSYRGKTFYRLDQVDLDGKATYSKVIEVDGWGADALTVYPNPGRGVFYLQYPPSADGQPYMVRVYDPYGQVISTGRVNSVDLSRQASGVYTIECLGDKTMLARVVLLK